MQDQQFEFVGSVAKPSTTAEDSVHCQACHLNAVGLWQGMEILSSVPTIFKSSELPLQDQSVMHSTKRTATP